MTEAEDLASVTEENAVPEENVPEENAAPEENAPEENADGEKPKKPGLIKRIKASGFFGPGTSAVFILFGLSVLVYILSRFISAFAEFWTRYPAQRSEEHTSELQSPQ